MPTTKDHMPMTKNKIFTKQYQKRTNMTSIGIGLYQYMRNSSKSTTNQHLFLKSTDANRKY